MFARFRINGVVSDQKAAEESRQWQQRRALPEASQLLRGSCGPGDQKVVPPQFKVGLCWFIHVKHLNHSYYSSIMLYSVLNVIVCYSML